MRTGNEGTEIKAENPKTKNKGCASGCLSLIIALFIIVAAGGVLMYGCGNIDAGIGEYVDTIPEESAQKIDAVLSECGIVGLDSAEHDETLDNAHFQGETGYRLTYGDTKNIILYLDGDNNVYLLKFADRELYANNAKVASLDDFRISFSEMTDYQVLCEEKVREFLKAPSTAKFPNYTEWGFAKDKNILTVQGYVDAQNSFGAMMRNTFQFIIDTDSNTIQSFILDGEQII